MESKKVKPKQNFADTRSKNNLASNWGNWGLTQVEITTPGPKTVMADLELEARFLGPLSIFLELWQPHTCWVCGIDDLCLPRFGASPVSSAAPLQPDSQSTWFLSHIRGGETKQLIVLCYCHFFQYSFGKEKAVTSQKTFSHCWCEWPVIYINKIINQRQVATNKREDLLLPFIDPILVNDQQSPFCSSDGTNQWEGVLFLQVDGRCMIPHYLKITIGSQQIQQCELRHKRLKKSLAGWHSDFTHALGTLLRACWNRMLWLPAIIQVPDKHIKIQLSSKEKIISKNNLRSQVMIKTIVQRKGCYWQT